METTNTSSSNFQEGYFITDWIEGNILLINWVGFCKTEDYQYGFLKAIEITREKRIDSWLLDFASIKVISPENQKWTAEVLIKKVNKAGVKKIAVVDLTCNLASTFVQCIYENFQPQIAYTRKVFASREAADQWLGE